MASIQRNGTGWAVTRSWFERNATNAYLDKVQEEGVTPKPESRTDPNVRRSEKGDENKKDVSSPGENVDAALAGSAVTIRKNLATALAEAIRQVISSHGKPKMALALQLLKRQLAKDHETLRPYKTEGDFLSIIVLVEAVLGNRDWKEISKEELTALRSEIRIGEKDPLVTYNHYLAAVRRLNASGWRTGPVIEFKDDEFSLPYDTNEPEPPDE